jgi:phenylacetate-CoA ligase
MPSEHAVVGAFHRAAAEVPAYRQILREAGVDPSEVKTLEDFRTRVPIIDKPATFGRFGVAELCRGGQLG